jgi:CheY-like chemotaxis protein
VAPHLQGNISSKKEVAMRVLIVDDNKAVANFLAIYFRDWGHEVLVSYDGHNALASASFRPDVVLTDLNLPDVHGFVLIEELWLKSETRNVTFLTMTASSDPSLKDWSKAVGAAAHFIKPLDTAELRRYMLQLEATIPTVLDTDAR